MSDASHFFDQFIDDYYAECDEHFATVRRVLLALEGQASSAPDGAIMQDLSRALHTVKGLSGMVGLSSAEETAHAMEDSVRAIQQGGGVHTELLESLFAGEALLEACVASRRAGTMPPSPDAYIGRVHDVIRASGQGGIGSASQAVQPVSAEGSIAPDARDAADVVQRFEFMPSAELAARGVGVEMIRRRLGSLGTIASTTPRVRPGGGVTFEFVVALRAGQLPSEEWRNDGLSWDRIEPANPVGLVVHTERRAPAQPSVAPANVVRVDLARLDDLMRMVGELVVTRSRLGEALERAGSDSSASWDDLSAANEAIERQLRTIREGVMRIRLVPIGEVFERMRFAMRDIARETGKSINLDFDGQDTEIDKLIVDRMLEPLLHLVRNSASHGIETAAERVARGKRPDGTIMLRAQAAGDRIVLEVEDDGGGIDVNRVARRAAEMGIAMSSATPGPDELLDIICSPGFSTRDAADMASGRGVGMAVARTAIRALGGELFVHSVAGEGTRFTIELPLTLMIADALILEIGDQAMAIPQIALREILPLDPAAVTTLENNQVLSYRGRVVPLISLGALFKLQSRPGAPKHVLIVGTDANLAGLVVDRIIGLREIVVHPVSDPLVAVPGVAGATELADGRVSLILDAAAIVRGTRDRGTRHQTRTIRPGGREAAALPAGSEGTWR